MHIILAELAAKIETSYFVLLVLLGINAAAALARRISLDRFSLGGLKRLGGKIISYSLAILALRLLEIGLIPLWRTTILSEIMVTFLAAIEAFNALDNLALLGVPIPANLVNVLLKNLKIPGLNQALKRGSNGDKGVQEIEDMLKFQIPAFHDPQINQLLRIKFEVWHGVAEQINGLTPGDNGNQNDLLYYRIMSLIELGFKDMAEKWALAGIPTENVEKFTQEHQPRVEAWLVRTKEICYTQAPAQIKKRQLIDALIVILYQTIIDSLSQYNGGTALEAGETTS